MSSKRAPLAAIDIGTNSFHLIVAEVGAVSGRFRVLDREKEIVRLGSGSSDMKHLSVAAMQRGIETLLRFKRIADAAGANIRAVATSAVREALNRDDFVQRVKNKAGIAIEIVSGVEEARLIYLGILQALPVFEEKILLVDIGGGSTEFLIGQRRDIFYDNSLKIGAVRLTERFFRGGKVTPESVRNCREYLSVAMHPVIRSIRETGYDRAVGSSGTITSIAGMIRSAGKENPPATLNGATFSKDELGDLLPVILKSRTTKSRSKLEGLDPGRADIIVAGALILEQIFKEARIKEMVVSEYALREGILLDTIEKKSRGKHHHNFDDIRYQSVLHLADTLRFERLHSTQVAALALRIFDQTRDLHHLGNAEREFLESAALLHEVGLFVSHAQHHRHSYYLIRNSELFGYNEYEKEIIANVARYHRKSHPKPKHEAFGSLDEKGKDIVRKLASILRIADGLDRTHSSLISDVICRRSRNTITFRLRKVNSSPIDIEIWGAGRKKELFEETFGIQLRFKVA
jgi:exopolyphosphatase / guanosine-5'-triphosphate,3'-diphosphate pyrophosphatase